jgi:Rod binding domain-containing protein
MNIGTGIDLIAGVIQSADPGRMKQATVRLHAVANPTPTVQLAHDPGQQHTSGVRVEPASFVQVLDRASEPRVKQNFNIVRTAATPIDSTQAQQSASRINPSGRAAVESPELAAAKKVEGFFLQQMLQFILPKDTSAEGSAAMSTDRARTQMATVLGQQLAETGTLGIANQIVPAPAVAAVQVPAATPASLAGSSGADNGHLDLNFATMLSSIQNFLSLLGEERESRERLPATDR